MSQFDEIDLNKLKTSSISTRKSKVDVGSFASPLKPGKRLLDLLDSMPRIYAGNDIRTVVSRIAEAAKSGKPVILAMGGHVVKCGLGPVIGDLISRGIVTTVAMNGAAAIHDAEIALFGHTSEDVYPGLQDGSFGMTIETADFMNQAAANAAAQGIGLGEAIGNAIVAADATHQSSSILAAASKASIPVTVHVALGTDIVHMHPSADGAAWGESTMRDFRILAAAISWLSGGVLLNVGSAVVLPEIILKAFAIAKNQGMDLGDFLSVNLDFLRQYRSNEQIVARASAVGGTGVSITGHHEILIPLIAGCVIETLEQGGSR
ncbi:MAG: hypothetical protein Q7N50_15440 [Armatimonadota bacterium]|nr:hypothetical protein [Armatimonadota bacterium]